MRGIANLVIVVFGLSLGWFLGKEPLAKDMEATSSMGESLLGQRQSKAMPRVIDDSLPEYLRLQALAEQGVSVDGSSLKASLGAILESDDEDELANLMRQWVALDPLGCFSYCRNLAEPDDRECSVSAWATQWALADPEAALAAVESSVGDLRYCVVGPVGMALGRTYPDEVLAMMEMSSEFNSAVLISVSEAVPQKAMAIARTMNDDFTARSILQSWLYRDREAALGYFSNQAEDIQRDLLEHMGKALAKVDPEFALEHLEEHRHLTKDSSADYRVFQAIGNALLGKGGDSAAAFLEELTSGTHPHESLLVELLPPFATRAPDQALALALRQTDKETLGRVVGKFASNDWDAAYASVMHLEDDSDRNRALEGLLSRHSRLPLDLPQDRLDSLLRIAEENDLEINIGSDMRLMPMEESVDLIAKYPEALDASLEYLLDRRSSEDLKLLAERLPDTPGRQRGLERAVKEWSGKDPVGAAEWVQGLEFEGDPGEIYEPLLASWSAYDPVAAREWLGSLEDDDRRALATKAFVKANAVVSSAEAWQAATDQGDLELQRLAMKGWAGVDPDAAAKVLEAMDDADPTLWETYEDAAQEHRAWDRFLNPAQSAE